jgi:hypothetical protein
MKNTTHLTQGCAPDLARQIALSVHGMAHWAASGPFGATCSQCQFWGYWQQRRNASGDIVSTKFRRDCCGKFFELTQQHGDKIPGSTEACRHFARLDEQP